MKKQFSIFIAILACINTVSAVSGAELILNPDQPRQGQTLEVKIRETDNKQPPEILFNKRNFSSFPNPADSGSTFRVLIGIPADIAPGKYSIRAGNLEKQIRVLPGGFPVQHLHLPSTKDNFIASAGEEAAVDAAKKTLTSEQLWQGKFQVPCKARVSASFGLRRVVNGHYLTGYFHSGIDYAGNMGAPVYAAQRGKVILAHRGWRLHGNVVAVDHGQGIVSFYLHLKEILVKPGELVKAGQQIGKVGRVVRANGPHLHFSIYANQESTNPLNWFANSFD